MNQQFTIDLPYDLIHDNNPRWTSDFVHFQHCKYSIMHVALFPRSFGGIATYPVAHNKGCRFGTMASQTAPESDLMVPQASNHGTRQRAAININTIYTISSILGDAYIIFVVRNFWCLP